MAPAVPPTAGACGSVREWRWRGETREAEAPEQTASSGCKRGRFSHREKTQKSKTQELKTQPTPMKILINVEGVEVEGAILHRTPCDIVVEILSPYQGLKGKSHIPYFMTMDNFIGPFGDERARTLLEDLYLCGRFLYPNLESLRSMWAELQEQLLSRPGRYTHEDFLRDRRAARARFRAGETTQQEYGHALKGFEQCKSKNWEAEHSAELTFFRLNWPKNVPRHVVGIEELLSAPNPEEP